MTHLLSAGRRLAALGLCAAAVVAAPFTARPADAARSGAELYITVTPRGAVTPSGHLTHDWRAQWTRLPRTWGSHLTRLPRYSGVQSLRLTCDPDGGYHPRPSEACDELRAVHGHVRALNVDPGPCMRIYRPVTVEVRGRWYGRHSYYKQEFSNWCEMERRLGPLV
ncbi:SSI family serine proteinase inhibitor [Nonomuraea terrae]|nr:SSI family serine proteinase inhibitor [Nonomuraea terrae]